MRSCCMAVQFDALVRPLLGLALLPLDWQFCGTLGLTECAHSPSICAAPQRTGCGVQAGVALLASL